MNYLKKKKRTAKYAIYLFVFKFVMSQNKCLFYFDYYTDINK